MYAFCRHYPIQSKRSSLFVFVVKHHMLSVSVVHNIYGNLPFLLQKFWNVNFISFFHIFSLYSVILKPDEFRLCGAFSHDIKFF